MIGEVIPNFTIKPYRANAGVGLERHEKVGAGRHHASANRGGGVVERKLRIDSDAKINDPLCGVLAWLDCGGFRRRIAPDPWIAGMVLVEAYFHTQQTLAKASHDTSGHRRRGRCRWLRTGLFNRDGELIFELNAVAEAVIEIEVRHLVSACHRIPVANPAEIDLPVLVAGCLGIVGAKGWAALSVGAVAERCEEKQK